MSFKPPHYARSGSFVVDGEEEGLAAPGDAAAEERISALLAEDRTLDAAQVIVRVVDGTAVLSGNVLTEQERHKAEACVMSLFPNMTVDNRIIAADATIEWERKL